MLVAISVFIFFTGAYMDHKHRGRYFKRSEEELHEVTLHKAASVQLLRAVSDAISGKSSSYSDVGNMRARTVSHGDQNQLRPQSSSSPGSSFAAAGGAAHKAGSSVQQQGMHSASSMEPLMVPTAAPVPIPVPSPVPVAHGRAGSRPGGSTVEVVNATQVAQASDVEAPATADAIGRVHRRGAGRPEAEVVWIK